MKPLSHFVHGRSGDKGSDVTIGIKPYDSTHYEWLRDVVTGDRVKDHLGSLVAGSVRRTELPQLPGLVFLCEDALPGGGLGNLRTDAQGKTYYQALTKLNVEEPT